MKNRHSKGDKLKIGYDRSESKIDDVPNTDDTLSNQGGLSFMLRNNNTNSILSMIEERFGQLHKSSTGKSIGERARQFIAFCMDRI